MALPTPRTVPKSDLGHALPKKRSLENKIRANALNGCGRKGATTNPAPSSMCEPTEGLSLVGPRRGFTPPRPRLMHQTHPPRDDGRPPDDNAAEATFGVQRPLLSVSDRLSLGTSGRTSAKFRPEPGPFSAEIAPDSATCSRLRSKWVQIWTSFDQS